MYIQKTSSISAQETFSGDFISKVKSIVGNKYQAIEPSYKGLIRPALLRRMGKSIRMGIGAGLPILQDSTDVDGIILGSSEGGLEDCIKFLNQIITYDEGSLTPTNFVQSTPNALAGSLALHTKNKGYNTTHVHKGLAFENALLDAIMLFEEHKAKTLLVGNVEEISEYNFNIETLAGQFKIEETSSENLLASNTKGTVCGEGSTMFLLSSEKGNAVSEIIDINHISFPEKNEIPSFIDAFLAKNNFNKNDIDTLVIGKSGDSRNDDFYDLVCNLEFNNTNIFTYKNLVGEYPTSSAFALYFSNALCEGKEAPKESIVKQDKEVKNILIYNHYKGEQHGLILVSKV